MQTSDFEYQENSTNFALRRIQFFLFSKVTARSNDVFLRGGDLISMPPQVTGVHEPHITALIDSFAQNGYNDFLIDIGANIGLTSCQNGRLFREVHMFEPNPLCCHILEVNAAITLNESYFEIHPIGLGDADKNVILTVPKHNWGGAFIDDPINSYDNNTIAEKDGFSNLSAEHYFQIEVTIKNTVHELQAIFDKLKHSGLRRGVIKIDVEGYEPTVLKGVANSLPEDVKAFIVFESWDTNFSLEEIMDAFNGRATASKLSRHAPWKEDSSVFVKAASLIFNRKIRFKLEPVANAGCFGDLVLRID